MKKIYFLGLFLLCAFFASAQVNWVLNNTNVGNNLNDVWFVNAQKGWVVGDNGMILYTPDAGNHWTDQSSATITTNLNSVSFASSNIGWAVGLNGKIVCTSNGGTTWSLQTSNTLNELKAVYFVNDSSGWTVGNSGTIRHTTNSGTTWVTQTFTVPQNLMATHFVNDTTGWIVGAYGQILFTQNAGAIWTQQTSGTTITLYGVYFTDKLHGWISRQDGKIMHTTNGGTSWAVQNTNTTKYMTTVFFNDTLNGWAAGQDGTTLHTTNGGTNWQIVNTGNINTIRTIFFANNHAGWMVGSAGTAMKYYDVQKICFVTYDPLIGKNRIIWERLWDLGTAFYKIYRLEAGQGFVAFDTVPFHTLSAVYDLNSNPQQYDYYYAITSVDSLGNESERCPHHRTMLLSVNQGQPGQMNLAWNAYKDSTGGIVPDYYIIYRGSTPNILDSIASKPAITGQENYAWIDLDATSLYYYQVGIRMPGACTATGESKDMSGPFSQSLSNIEDNSIWISVDELNNKNTIRIYPNPSTGKVFIKTEKLFEVNIFNILGELIQHTNTAQQNSVELSVKGVYMMEFINKNEKFYKRVVVE